MAAHVSACTPDTLVPSTLAVNASLSPFSCSNSHPGIYIPTLVCFSFFCVCVCVQHYGTILPSIVNVNCDSLFGTC